MIFGRRQYRPPSSKARFSQRLARVFSVLMTIGFLLVIVCIAGFIVWGIHGFLYRSDYFAIREVVIVEGLDARESLLAQDTTHLLGDFEMLRLALRSRLRKAGMLDGNLLALELPLVEGITEGHPEVQEATASKRYPGFLELRVRRREPVALVPHDPLLSMDNPVWAIDSDGYVLRRLTTEDPLAVQLPYVTGLDTREVLKDGRIVSESLTPALRLLSLVKRGAPSLWREVSEVRVEGGAKLTLMLMGGTEVRFLADGPKALTNQLAALDEFLSSDADQARSAAYIDLRVEGQVASMPKTAIKRRE